MILFLDAAATAPGADGSMIIMLVALVAVFYFFMIRPENKRKKEAQQMRDALKVGDNIRDQFAVEVVVEDDKIIAIRS